MINLNEPSAAGRRIPFYVTDISNTGVTGIVFTGSDIKLSKNGAAWANFAGSVTEIGGGLYSYQCSASEVDTTGFLALRYAKTGIRTQIVAEIISSSAYLTTFRMPCHLVDISLVDVIGLTFSGSQIQISRDGDGYANFAGAMTEVGLGLYYYTPTSGEITGISSFTMKVEKTGIKTVVLTQDLQEGQASGDSTDPVIDVISTPSNEEEALAIQVYDESGIEYVELLCKDRSDGPGLMIYETGEGFIHPFTGRSTVTGSGETATPYVFTVYRRGRWPTGLDLTIRIKVVDTGGNVKQSTVTIRC